jgi:surfactin synthase thioesterase subunit
MKVNLFCFPFAGGSKYSYNNYVSLANKNIKVIPIDYPGRGLRFKEPLVKKLDTIIEACFDKIKNDLQKPYAIYGHSMGTIISYLVTKRIIKEGLNPPSNLFLSGRGGPSVVYNEPARYLLPSNEFRNQLKEMGGCPDEVLNDEDLMSFFEPILRADFEALEVYQYEEPQPFDIPITVMIGEQERVTIEQASAWQKETKVKIDLIRFPGKHFFIYDHAPEIMKIIEQKLLNENVIGKAETCLV